MTNAEQALFDLAWAVAHMRAAQRTFEKCGTAEDARKMREHERRVDELVSIIILGPLAMAPKGGVK